MVEPRFSGGTAGAVAAEIRALGPLVDLRVHFIETAMFKGREVNPVIAAALAGQGLAADWNAPVIGADTVVFHNPSCLRFNRGFTPRISCQRAFVVTHENFLRPGGVEGFDVAGCLALLDGALIAGRRWLAPVSASNRANLEAWRATRGGGWRCAPFTWHNIFDLPPVAPTAAPRDRRGRHSRPGPEKFPDRATMLRHFPRHAESNVILGGDAFLLDPDLPDHWQVHRFGTREVAEFLSAFDFFVYYTHPLWRESFGRVIAEAIAAGKLVITDPETARTFGEAVVASDGDDVDAIIRGFVEAPDWYHAFVEAAQATLPRFGPAAFTRDLFDHLETGEGEHDVPV